MKEILEIKLTLNNLPFKVYVHDILRLEGCENYTYIFSKGGNRFISSYTLKHLEEMLPKKLFLRVHKKHLININTIKHFESEAGKSNVFLKSGEKLTVSRRKNREINKDIREGLINNFKFIFSLIS